MRLATIPTHDIAVPTYDIGLDFFVDRLGFTVVRRSPVGITLQVPRSRHQVRLVTRILPTSLLVVVKDTLEFMASAQKGGEANQHIDGTAYWVDPCGNRWTIVDDPHTARHTREGGER